MKNKKMLKVLSTSFILGTILMTNPTGAEKAEDLSLSEKLVDNQDLTNSVTSETKETKVVSDDSETTEEKTPELTNDGDSKENSEKLELSSDTEKETVRANENGDSELISPEAKFDEDMSIDDPATYDYAGYFIKHYNPTNEKFMKERNNSIFMIDDVLADRTDAENRKIVSQNITLGKGKDLSSKIDEYIAELEKNKGNNKIDAKDIQNKVFGENSKFSSNTYFTYYLNTLYNLYNSTSEGDGDGHKLITDGKLLASDFSVENFKEINKNGYNNEIHYVTFTINNSFRNRPIIWGYQIFLSEDQYFQYRNTIIDFLKSEAGFKNLTFRGTSFGSLESTQDDVNSQKLPNNIKKVLPKKYFETNDRDSIYVVYDTKNINKDSKSYSKKDLKKAFDEGDSSIDKNVFNDESFTLRVGFGLSSSDESRNDLPKNYYFSKNNKLIFKGNDKLAFKQKSNTIGSAYYISNTTTDRDDFTQRFTKYLLESAKDDEDFNKLTKKEQDEYIQSQIQEMMPYIEDAHKDDKENIRKYQAFLNSEKWGNQRLTQYVGNVDTKTEEKDFKIIKKDDPTLEKGQTKVVKKGVKGKKVTKITYKVDRTSGELTDPISEVVEEIKPVDEVILVGTKKVVPAKPIEDIATTTKITKESIKAKVFYEADDTLEFEKQNVVTKPVDGEKEVTTVSQKGKKNVVTEKVIKDKVDGVTKVGNKKVEVKTKDGVTTTTTTVYEVDKETGKLVNPKVTVKKTAKIETIEDIAKKVSSKDIDYETTYVAKADLEYEKQEVFQKGVKGTKEITQVGSEKPVEKITKKPVDEIIGVGNKKVVTENVKVNGKDAKKITTTIYEVDKKTGKLINPKSTVKTILNAEKIEDTAKKVIPAEKIQDIAKKVMPAAKIEDIAKKTIPAKRIEDIATKVNKDNEKDTIKTTNSEPKKTAHLPKAGTSSEILTLAIGALATISGASLSKKRRK